MLPTPPQQEASGDKLREALSRLPAGYSLIPSQVYYFFILDQDGRNRGYLTEGGEVRWWASSASEARG